MMDAPPHTLPTSIRSTSDGVNGRVGGDWSNWAKNITARPNACEMPGNLVELQDLVRRTPELRVVGAGHSFNRLVATDAVLASLDNYAGAAPSINLSENEPVATLNAGNRLYTLCEQLSGIGYAFKNLGDINVQSFAGAVSTGTHGTGAAFGCLSSEMVGARIVNGCGDIVSVSHAADKEIHRAAQVALGALGVIVEAEVKVVPSFNLHRRIWAETPRETLDSAMDRWETHRNYEFYYLPFSDTCASISHDQTAEAPRVSSEGDDEAVLLQLKKSRDILKYAPWLRRKLMKWALRRMPIDDMVGESWRMLASERNFRFKEIEYHLPLENGLKIAKSLIDTVENRHPDVFFPIEVRRTAGDEGMMSPFSGGPRISIAVHAYYCEAHLPLFEEVEALFIAGGGRPHWGKMHTLNAGQIKNLYPEVSRFDEIRREFDPKDKFVNPYLKSLLDIQ